MSADLTITHLVLNASTLVQLVMLLLLAASLLSWTLIFQKWQAIRYARSHAEQFEKRFWSGADLSELYRKISSRRDQAAGMETIFEAGFSEFARLRNKSGIEPMSVVDGAQRAMRVAMNREVDALEMHLSFLATVGSTSPYVGLFGTVWGIMNAFIALGNVQQATIASVAPGIAEALVATAMGLFAAIPAVIAYNRYSNDVDRLLSRYDIFMEEFSTILQRQAHV
ncbi:MAG: protein TolQ [Gammaproteobacteria bacterium]|nr:protein TolQ [Gammaproteobacteria bacterium]